jgi:hypothetical protein
MSTKRQHETTYHVIKHIEEQDHNDAPPPRRLLQLDLPSDFVLQEQAGTHVLKAPAQNHLHAIG